VRDLSGIGLDRIAGYFGTDVIENRGEKEGQLQVVRSLNLPAIVDQLRSDDKLVLDVRAEHEWRAGHLPGSLNLPLGELEERLAELPKDGGLIVHCQSGGRAAIATSLLLAHGFQNVALFSGGFSAWQSAGKPVENA
jgi:hydroxyacylglutathione hydrolase